MAEKWNLFTRIAKSLDFQQTDQTIERGQKLPDGTFHHVVHAWIRFGDEYLISQRCAEKSDPLCWEPTGGSVLAGETARQAAVREVKEELGIDLDPDSGTFVCRGVRFFPGCNDFVDVYVWLFEKDYKSIEKSLTLQKEEVNAAVTVSAPVIHFLREKGYWIPWQQFDYLDEIIGKKKTLAEATEEEWRETIRDLLSGAISFGAKKLFDLELQLTQEAYGMEMDALKQWPPTDENDRDIRLGEAESELAWSLMSVQQYEESEERINKAIMYFEAAHLRGEKTTIWRLQHAHFCKRRIMNRTGRKNEALAERAILRRIKDGTFTV